MSSVLVVIGTVAFSMLFFAVILLLVRRYERQRTEAMSALADELGLEFMSQENSELMDALGHLHLFQAGHSHKMKNVIAGQTNEIDLAIFGYQYTTGSGKNQQTVFQTVICFRSPQLDLPQFELRPESVFHKIGKVLGYQDINFESNPRFSKRYLLRGPDEQQIRDFFTPELLRFFESQEKVSVEASGNLLVYYRAGKRLKPEMVREFMQEGFAVFGSMTGSQANEP